MPEDFVISPIVGRVSIEESFSLVWDYDRLISEYSKAAGVRRYVIPAILKTEHEFGSSKVSGKEIYDYLVEFGFSESVSLNAVKLMVANDSLVERLIEKGYPEQEVLYEMDYLSRMRRLGLSGISVMKRYALEHYFVVHPLKYVTYEIPAPELCYRTQLAYLYVAKDKKDSTPEVIAEFRVWGVSSEPGTYRISAFERVIMQMERIMKGNGKKPINWLASIDKVIKASEEDEPIDCDEVREINYAQRGVAFRGEIGSWESFEYDEKWIKTVEKQMNDEGTLVTRFDNEKGILINIQDGGINFEE